MSMADGDYLPSVEYEFFTYLPTMKKSILNNINLIINYFEIDMEKACDNVYSYSESIQ